MTPADIERLAREAGFRVFAGGNIVAADGGSSGAASESLARFAALVRAQALEDAARACDRRVMGDLNREDMEARACAAAIRALIPKD